MTTQEPHQPPEEPCWPPSFPHADIDALVARLSEAATADCDEAALLLQLVAKEAQRLRNAVVRLSVSRLSAAEREANEILAEARSRADEVRTLALRVLDDRLDEAEELLTAMRRTFLIEHRLAGATGPGPRMPDRGEPDVTLDPDVTFDPPFDVPAGLAEELPDLTRTDDDSA